MYRNGTECNQVQKAPPLQDGDDGTHRTHELHKGNAVGAHGDAKGERVVYNAFPALDIGHVIADLALDHGCGLVGDDKEPPLMGNAVGLLVAAGNRHGVACRVCRAPGHELDLTAEVVQVGDGELRALAVLEEGTHRTHVLHRREVVQVVQVVGAGFGCDAYPARNTVHGIAHDTLNQRCGAVGGNEKSTVVRCAVGGHAASDGHVVAGRVVLQLGHEGHFIIENALVSCIAALDVGDRKHCAHVVILGMGTL